MLHNVCSGAQWHPWIKWITSLTYRNIDPHVFRPAPRLESTPVRRPPRSGTPRHSSSTSPPLRHDGRSRSRPVRARPTPPLAPPPTPLRGAPFHCAPARAPIAKSRLSSAVHAPHTSRERRRVCGRAVPCTSRRHRAENPAHSAPTEAAGGRWPIATIVTKCSLTGSSPSCLGWLALLLFTSKREYRGGITCHRLPAGGLQL